MLFRPSMGALLCLAGFAADAATVTYSLSATFRNTGFTPAFGVAPGDLADASGTLSFDTGSVRVIPARTVLNSGGDAFTSDVYGIQAADLLSFSITVASKTWTSAALQPRIAGPGFDALIWASPTLDAPASLSFFVSDSAGQLSWNAAQCARISCSFSPFADARQGFDPFQLFAERTTLAHVSTVPEPASGWLLLTALAVVASVGRRTRSAVVSR